MVNIKCLLGLFAYECWGCVYLLTARGACTVTRGTLSFREVVGWLEGFFVISDNICTNYLFERNTFSKSYCWWCFECFSIIWIDILYMPVFADYFLSPSANPTKWSNTLKQFDGNMSTNCLSVFDHFVGLGLKGLRFGVGFYVTDNGMHDF